MAQVVPAEEKISESNVEGEPSAAEEAEKATDEAEAVKGVSCCALFRFANCCDMINFAVGFFFTCLSALAMPFFAIILGELIHMGFMVRIHDYVYAYI